ncbi:unnamed protein product [Brugia pahangi]|uniref:Uncharacterized protein n=1 Tax=Brugia pahangi TaxID=6280 RepID=A0A0N4T3T0_BRUPA|nr:unnamed protein product [Brugia pahangi]
MGILIIRVTLIISRMHFIMLEDLCILERTPTFYEFSR